MEISHVSINKVQSPKYKGIMKEINKLYTLDVFPMS